MTVHQLRKILDQPHAPSHVQTEGEWLVLRPVPSGPGAAGWLDAAAFAQAAAAALLGKDSAACRAALACYGGEYLPDDPYHEWAVGRREELHRQRQALLLHLATLCVAEGLPDEAVGYLTDALRADPCHEEAARALMRLHAVAGRRVEAMRVYRRLVTALKQDLSLQPEQETIEVYRPLRQITAPAQVRSPAAQDPPPTNLPAPLTSFVGREQAITDVAALLAGGGPAPAI